MATSPPYAGSPPGAGTPMSRKRPSLSTQIPNIKRRKPSTAGPSHLRQTSFPPDEILRDVRSPSVESSALVGTPSAISGVGPGKRGKRAKSGSVVANGSRVNGAGRAISGSAVDGAGADEEPEEEDEDGDLQENLRGDQGNAEEQKAEKEAMRILVAAFTPEQTRKYVQFTHLGHRSIGPRIRKLANHTLSQSVPHSVVLAISSYTKVFMGEVIEMARRVQLEWQASELKFPNGEPVPADAPLSDRIKEENRGPLTPDHLREAVRRIKSDRLGGAAGFQGISLTGRQSTAAKMGGRKLFR